MDGGSSVVRIVDGMGSTYLQFSVAMRCITQAVRDCPWETAEYAVYKLAYFCVVDLHIVYSF